MYDIAKIREDFPILSRKVYGKPLVYLDNGATTQKPRCVVDSMVEEYYNVNANVHRGVHFLSQQATELHEQSRETIRQFINAHSTAEIVFTRGTTESINLVAQCFGEYIAPSYPPKGGRTNESGVLQQASPFGGTGGGLEIIISTVEHHSNLVPWQMLCERLGGTLRVIPMSDDGVLNIEAYKEMFNEHTRFVSVAHVSNVLGTVNPVKEMTRIAHEHGVPIMVDGAQSTPHFKVDVQDIDCDFFAFSGHKIYGPTGIGVLYGKEEWLDRLPPYMFGGEMINTVSFEHTTFNELPFKFEAGTPDYVATTGLARALDYVTALGMDNIEAHERELTQYALKRMEEVGGIKVFGNSFPHDAVISFEVMTPSPSGEGWGGAIHHLDLGTLLDRLGIAVRTGHHCAEPLMHRLGIQGTTRASFGLYNTKEEIDALIAGIERVRKMF